MGILPLFRILKCWVLNTLVSKVSAVYLRRNVRRGRRISMGISGSAHRRRVGFARVHMYQASTPNVPYRGHRLVPRYPGTRSRRMTFQRVPIRSKRTSIMRRINAVRFRR